jgi:hypothetical protein
MTPFGPPRAVARLLEGLDVPWFIAGGWAIDLFLERETRPHDDVEVAVLRRDQWRVRRHLAGWEFVKVVSPVGSGRREPWREGERLELPVHEIHARGPREPGELEILLNEAEGEVWKFRRDPRVTRPMAEIGDRSDLGIPYLRPEIAILYKAKRPRERDEADFRLACPALSHEAKAWLRAALGIVHPGHPWIRTL